jgi:hypothetical protein
MTALALSSIPPAINTVERLIAWAGMTLQNVNLTKTINVTADTAAVPQAQVQYAVFPNGVPHFAVTVYVPVDDAAVNSPTQKVWMAANEISTATPHINFLSN